MDHGSIDPAAIAAFIDGTLKPKQREEMIRALANSPELYELMVEAAAVSKDVKQQQERAAPAWRQWIETLRQRATQIPGGLTWPVLVPAILAGVLLVARADRSPAAPAALYLVREAAWLARLPQRPSDTLARPDDRATGTLAIDWDRIEWPGSRGSTPTGAQSGSEFRAGVLLVNFEVAARLGDGARRSAAAEELKTVLGDVPSSGPAVSSVESAAGAESTDFRDVESSINDLMGDSPWYPLGVWVGQARLAAQAGDLSFFESSGPAEEALGGLRGRLAADPATENSASAQATLDQVNALHDDLASGRPNSTTALAESLQSIITLAAARR
jgi:hypothetical protein